MNLADAKESILNKWESQAALKKTKQIIQQSKCIPFPPKNLSASTTDDRRERENNKMVFVLEIIEYVNLRLSTKKIRVDRF